MNRNSLHVILLCSAFLFPGALSRVSAAVPDFLWAKQGGSSESDSATAVTVDLAGNTYAAGYFGASATFGSTTLTSSGDTDLFVAKYSTSGNLLWLKRAGGPGADAAYGIAVSSTGEVFVTGQFSGNAAFDSIVLRSSGDSDIFIAKYSDAGNVVWARRAGGSEFDLGLAVATDSDSNVYVTGEFTALATFGGTTVVSAGDTDLFVAKFDNGGNQHWVRRAGGTGFDAGTAIAVDSLGNPHITGYFSGTASLSNTNLTSGGVTDILVAKFDEAGKLAWAQKAGGASDDYGFGIGIDGSDHVYVTGSFRDRSSFGSTAMTANGDSDAFIAKFNSSGVAQWVRQAGGPLSDAGNSIAVDITGDVTISGAFEGTMSVGATNLTSRGSIDAFIARYSSTNLVWAVNAGGAQTDLSTGLAVDSAGDVYVTGLFGGVGNFGTTVLNSARFEDAVIFKLAENRIPRITQKPSSQTVVPGSTVTFQASAVGTHPLTYIWLLNGTPIAGQTSSNLVLSNVTVANGGTYTVVATNFFGVSAAETKLVVTDRRVSADFTIGFSGETIPVPISLRGQGTENTIAFSLAYDTALLKFQSVSNGISPVTNLNVVWNTNLTSSGKVGFLLSLPTGQRFPPGTNQMIRVYFQAATGLARSNSIPITFTDSPVFPEVVSAEVDQLPVVFQNGILRIEDGLEADLSPRNSGDRLLTTADFTLLGRMVAGLSTATNASEFARADCSPIVTRGDGRLTAADWTQAGRYVAGIDSPQTTAGPTNPVPTLSSVLEGRSVGLLGAAKRELKLGEAKQSAGLQVSIPVSVRALGNENAFGFSVNFDAQSLEFVNVRLGSGVSSAQLIVNNGQAAQGRIGVLLGLNPGHVLAAGSSELAILTFNVKGSAASGQQPIAFGDSPIIREVVSAEPVVLPAQYLNGAVTIEGSNSVQLPATSRWLSDGSLEISWSGAQGAYKLELSTNLVDWQILSEVTSKEGTVTWIDLNAKQQPIRFYRLTPVE